VLARRLLRIDEVAVDDNLENAPARRDQGEFGRRVLELFEDLRRQTGGPVEVTSDRAILDRDLHASPPRLGPAWRAATRLC
jgi:hypothetical protein